MLCPPLGWDVQPGLVTGGQRTAERAVRVCEARAGAFLLGFLYYKDFLGGAGE